jgi:hypothetical protein
LGIIDKTGKVFDRLTVIKFSHIDSHRKSHWLCKCLCGKEKIVSGFCLTSGKTKSCGCLRRETTAALGRSSTTHGLSKTKEYMQENSSKNHFIRRYGMSEEQINILLESQNGHCALCPSTLHLEIDHNHITGFVRGLLCRKCNALLGLANDSTLRLYRAIDYLLKENI